MKIMLVSSLYEPHRVGGAELVAQELAEGLAAGGDECVVVTLGEERETRHINGVRVHYLPIRNLYWPFDGGLRGDARKAAWHALDSYNPLMGRALSRVIAEENPDVVNTHAITGVSVAAWRAVKRAGKPLVHTLHDLYLLCPKTSMFKDQCNCVHQCRDCNIYSVPRKAMSKLPDTVIGVSGFVLERHREYGLFEHADQRVIYNACALNGASSEGRAHPLDEPLRFGFLGRMHPTKGVEHLIGAFLALESHRAQLWLAGSGPDAYISRLKAATRTRGDIHWAGYVEPEAFLSQLDVLVVPSLWHEPAGRVVQEAFAAGIPVIGARRGGIPELMSSGTGWLFEPDRRGELAAILAACIRGYGALEAMRGRARARAQRYTHGRMLSAYRSAYLSAIQRCTPE